MGRLIAKILAHRRRDRQHAPELAAALPERNGQHRAIHQIYSQHADLLCISQRPQRRRAGTEPIKNCLIALCRHSLPPCVLRPKSL